jgi:predicted phage terminase large subunit-like protein
MTVINQPPATMKSLLVNVFAPAWLWTIEPEHRFMLLSHTDGVVLRDSEKTLRILKSPLYQAAWPRVRIKGGQTAKQAIGNYETLAGGARYSFSLRGGVTGWHADTLSIDDPLKPAQADAPSGVELEKVEALITGTLRTRRRDASTFGEICIMQRLADSDPSDWYLNHGAEHICLPMEYVPDCSWDRGNRFGVEDPRTEKGELLWADRFPADVVAKDREAFEPATAVSQYQQNPTPKVGAFFEADWFRWYDELPNRSALTFLQVWDLGMKGRDGGKKGQIAARSRVHGALWAWDQAERRLLMVDERHGLLNYASTKEMFVQANAANLWSQSIAAIVEEKANGIALISELRADVPIIKPWEPSGSKEQRARRHSARVESGVVWLPQGKPWAEEMRAELVKFPRARLNDRVDTTTMLLDYVYQPGGIALLNYQGLVDFFARG